MSDDPMPAHRVAFREILPWANDMRECGVQISIGQAKALLDGVTKAVEADRATLVERNKVLEAALRKAEDADDFNNNCEECDPADAPETCEHCFPLADEARLMRWAALGIHLGLQRLDAGAQGGSRDNRGKGGKS